MPKEARDKNSLENMLLTLYVARIVEARTPARTPYMNWLSDDNFTLAWGRPDKHIHARLQMRNAYSGQMIKTSADIDPR